MNKFAISRPRSFEQAGALLTDDRFALPMLKAGGMDVVDHVKEGLESPDLLIDIRHLRQQQGGDGIAEVRGTHGLHIEATTVLADIAHSRIIREKAPVIAQAVHSAATPQVRNVASAAGSLLQRPRCWYYRNEQFDCLKKGGHQCYAFDGENAYHAIFGDGPCHIVHPSNLAPALVVCDATVHLGSATGTARRSLPIADLFHMPDAGLQSEHTLKHGEIITHITCGIARSSGFYAIKHKQSFDWPLAMAAVALELNGSTITNARVCAGAVAPIPWPLPKVNQALRGVDVDDDKALRNACAVSIDGASPMSDNAYKLKLLPVAVRRAVLKAAGRNVEEVAS